MILLFWVNGVEVAITERYKSFSGNCVFLKQQIKKFLVQRFLQEKEENKVEHINKR